MAHQLQHSAGGAAGERAWPCITFPGSSTCAHAAAHHAPSFLLAVRLRKACGEGGRAAPVVLAQRRAHTICHRYHTSLGGHAAAAAGHERGYVAHVRHRAGLGAAVQAWAGCCCSGRVQRVARLGVERVHVQHRHGSSIAGAGNRGVARLARPPAGAGHGGCRGVEGATLAVVARSGVQGRAPRANRRWGLAAPAGG